MKKTIDQLRKPQPGDFCILCGKTPYVIGIFIPDNPTQYGAPINKRRMIRYCLCEECHRKPDAPDRVEKAIQVELLGVAHDIS